jgi:uncharacterized protein
LIYPDTCGCIYAVEHASQFHEQTLAAFDAAPSARFAISPLTIAECWVGPIQSGDPLLVGAFGAFIRRLIVLECTQEVFRRAAQVRATSTLKMPDALHMACAAFYGCEQIWTNDGRLHEATDLARVIVT